MISHLRNIQIKKETQIEPTDRAASSDWRAQAPRVQHHHVNVIMTERHHVL